jgi:hypothetical protein
MQNVSGSAAAWQQPLALTDGRFTQIPNGIHALLENARELQLVVHLLTFRWYPTSPIIPSVATLARAMKCSARTVRRTAAALESRGLLERQERRAHDKRQMSNEYVLCGPLLALVTDLEANRDQEARSSWQGRRSAVPVERYSGNQTNRTRQQNGRSTPPGCSVCGAPRHGPHLKPECYRLPG